MEAASFKPVDFHKLLSLCFHLIIIRSIPTFPTATEFIPPIEPEKTIETPDFPRNLITEGLMEITLSAQGHLSRPVTT